MSIEQKEKISLGKNDTLNRFLKRAFDVVVSFIGVVITAPVVIISALLVRICYGESGFFTQTRVGMNGSEFKILKIKSMSSKVKFDTTVTTNNDPRITKLGRFFRKTKIDELPQLMNVIKGEMSFVGPRPDVKSLVESINEKDKEIFLSVRPGITGPASLKYKDEEDILAKVDNPKEYNDKVIFPDKVKLNEEYIRDYKFFGDVKYIINTVIS